MTGRPNVAPVASAKVAISRMAGVVTSAIVRMPSVAAVSTCQNCVMITSRRRSTTSASAPAGSESRNGGRDVAVCSSATTAADAVSEVISHELPISCIHAPRFDANPATQNAQKILDNGNL